MIGSSQLPRKHVALTTAGHTISDPWWKWLASLFGVGGNVVNGLTPVGAVIDWPGTAIPTNWLPCDGRALSQATYPTLFATLGGNASPWGGVAGGNFNIPNIADFTRGTNGGAVGATGGRATQTLTAAEMPLQTVNITDLGHTHTITDPGHAHTGGGTGNNTAGSNPTSLTAANTGTNTTGITINSHTTGITATVGNASPTSVSVLPPFTVITKIIYAPPG